MTGNKAGIPALGRSAARAKGLDGSPVADHGFRDALLAGRRGLALLLLRGGRFSAVLAGNRGRHYCSIVRVRRTAVFFRVIRG